MEHGADTRRAGPTWRANLRIAKTFSFSFAVIGFFIAFGLFSGMRRDAENCPKRSNEQFNLKPNSWERSSSAK